MTIGFRATLIILSFLATVMAHPLKAESLGGMVESFGNSIGQGLENLGQQLNRANDAFLGNGNNNSYEAQMRQYRQLEAAKVREMSEATGVSQDYIRKLRSDGMTWEEIANQYGVNLDNLPAPQLNQGN